MGLARWFLWTICTSLLQNSIARTKQQTTQDAIVVKLVVFIDAELKYHLENNLKISSDDKLEELVGAYISQVESNFSGLKSESFDGVRFELIESRPFKPRKPSNGDIDELLDEFCHYQWETKQTKSDKSWQLSLLLTSLDLFSSEDAKEYGSLAKSQTTMGISVIDGINWPSLGCLIVEFGVHYNESIEVDSSESGVLVDSDGIGGGRYMNPSRGFASTWVATHEIGHSLGLHHDGPPFNPECEPSSGWVMSPDSLVESISLEWSKCSLESISQLINTSSVHVTSSKRQPIEINRLPGQIFDLKSQCETFAANLEAIHVEPIESICSKTVWCQPKANMMRPSSEPKLVAIGPALEGTICDESGSKVCFERRCKQVEGLARCNIS